MVKVTVLIAAGNAADADELESVTKAEGLLVIDRVSSGDDAVALAASCHPDVVLMDARLCGTLGLADILTRIQTDNGIPVVLIASTDSDLPAPRPGSDAPSGCLVRPFGPKMFRQVVQAAISRHSPSGGTGGKKRSPAPMVRKVAHDINNSLSSALANIQIARRSTEHKDSLCRHLDDAEKSILRARDQSHQLLLPGAGQANVGGAWRKRQPAGTHTHTTPRKNKGDVTGCRILLMDDEDAILSATSDMLSFLGHKVTVAKSGEESLVSYRKAQADGLPFDVVILDITVPGGIGAEETLPRLREIDPDVRAIISSGYATHPLLINFAASGYAAALIKPYGFKELEESLKRASVPK
jgi:CheY-like chemotaxis protein